MRCAEIRRGGNNATDGRVVWPAINLTTGDPIVYWPTQSTTNSVASYSGFNGFAIQYPGSGTPGNWRLPQSSPTLGTTGNCDPLTASGMHSGVVLVAMGDGAARSVAIGVSSASWNAALSPAGSDTIGSDF
ncbi:MAG: hypothetical protein FJ303_24145 [Planctomycetes bacterium]|nr:hypothetical protein [Planctomycetota bacterium]